MTQSIMFYVGKGEHSITSASVFQKVPRSFEVENGLTKSVVFEAAWKDVCNVIRMKDITLS
jgi:hypothetical protein